LTQIAVRHGCDKKRNNAIAAVLCGALPAVAERFHTSPDSWGMGLIGLIVGLICGLIWGNAFEYVYHRWLLHQSASPLGAEHREHHAQIGTPEQAEHVALISSPVNIILLFVINGVPAFLITSLIGLRGILSGIFVGWAVYLIATEEIHWRIHMNGWLPPGLRFARAYHMSHHARANSRYNIFLPLFDFLFGNTGPGRSQAPV
jgi:sterol desaturase/sphingolipid hydroxylase (fatty acid hydroxylase superfamily)